MRVLAVALLGLALVTCAPRSSQVVIDNRIDVTVRISPEPDELPFNPRGARLLAASHQLSALLGHGLSLTIDAALVAEWRANFETQLVESVESLLRLLTAIQGEDSARYARVVPNWTEVRCRYSVLVEEANATFDGHALVIELPARAEKLIPNYAVVSALREFDLAWLDDHFMRVQPEVVALSEAQEYFRWLSRDAFGYRWEKRHPAATTGTGTTKAANDSQGDVIERVVRLCPRVEVADPALAGEVRAWLFSRLKWLAQLHQVHEDELPPAGSSTSMRRGEHALCTWLERELPRASAVERLEALEWLFPTSEPFVCTNIDRFSFGMRIVDEWLKSGKPPEGGEGADARLMDAVVCPSLKDSEGAPVRRRGCQPRWLSYVLGDASSLKQLAAALDTRDPELTEQLYSSLKYKSPDGAVTLMGLLDPKKPAFFKAMSTAADVWRHDRSGSVKELAGNLWRRHPESRGDVLYLLARTEGEYLWEQFVSQYDSIQRTDLERFLDHGEQAFEVLPLLWPALGKGFSRTQPIVNHLASLMPDASQPGAAAPLRTLSKVVTRLCDEHAKADIAALHAVLETRAADRPTERSALAILLRDTGVGGCAARTKER